MTAPGECFLAAISASAGALDAFAARLPPARRAALRRVTSADGTLFADVVATPLPTEAGVWVAGRLAPGGEDRNPHHRDGDFIALRQLADGFELGRDLIGACPLYEARAAAQGAALWLASSSAAELNRLVNDAPHVDPVGLQRFLGTGAVAGSARTLFRGVGALLRGRLWQVRGRDLRLSESEQPDPPPHPALRGTPRDRIEALRALLLQAASSHFEPELAVPLSGGIDSSGLLAAVAQQRGQGVPAYTFRMGPDGPIELDEARWAVLAAQATGARHRVVTLDPERIPELMTLSGAAQDFPFASPVILAQRELFQRAASDGMRVLLGGHGPDLLCGGADTHLTLLLAQLLRTGRLLSAAHFWRGAGRHAAAGATRLLAAALRAVATGESPLEPRLAPDPWLAPTQASRSADSLPAQARLAFAHRERPLHALIAGQLTHSLGASSLLYERGNAAACGIEVRQPYLASSFWSLTLACAAHELISMQGQPKHLLRQALAGLLPAEILAREHRIGFAVPIVPWLVRNRAWVDQGLGELRSLPLWAGPSPDEFWRLLDRKGAEAARTAFRIWRWLSLLEWSRRHNVGFG